MSYLVVAWPQAEPAFVADLLAAAPRGWRVAVREPGRLALVGGAWPAQVQSAAGGLILGEAHGRAEAAVAARGEHARTARQLCGTAWGGYVAVLEDETPVRWAVLRCPSGGLDALAWGLGEALLVAGDLAPWFDPWLPPGLSISWERVASILADPALATGEAALTSIQAIAPGALWSPPGRSDAIWTPADAARSEPLDLGEAQPRLRHVVDEVVQTMAGARTIIELSGGLDSAIVASALQGRGALAVNYFSGELGGDERVFAREVAGRLGIDLLEVEKPPPHFDLAALQALAGGARPALNALDFEHDQDMARRCGEHGADVLLTGQGGDHVFFQAPSALIAADALGFRRRGGRGPEWGLGPAMLARLARRTGRSAWSVLGQALGARLSGRLVRPGLKGRPPHVSAAAWEMANAGGAHPWLADMDGLLPAKALQVACLAAAQTLNGASRRGEAARLRHPLLSQPVMELCLPLPIPALTQGGHDRALARDAFANRLPAGVIQRQGKGRLTSHYGRLVASGLSVLRPLLLEGRLVQKGLIDRPALDQILTLEHLAWRGGYGAIMTSAALELWVRSWEARLGARPGRL